MPNYTQKELEERYQKLPDVLKNAMFNADIAAKIFEIGKKHGLTIDKIGFMAEETGYIILGLTRPAEFVQGLNKVLAVEESRARAIAIDLSHQILFPLREALKTTHQIEVNEETIQKNFVILKKPVPPQTTTAPAPPIIPRPPEPLPPQTKPAPAPVSQPSLPPLLSPKPLVEKPATSISTPPFKSPAEKTALLLSPLPTTPKIEPIDLRLQQKIRPPAPPPRPEPMGGSIFGAPTIVNLAPKPPSPPQPQTPKPPIPKSMPGYDPYKEPIE